MKVQRHPNHPRVLSTRPMVEADLESLRQRSARPDLSGPLRDSHHMVARYIAAGMDNREISETTGYSHVRISVLRHSPAMTELVAHYRDMVTEAWRAEQDALASLAVRNMVAAERQLSDKLDAADEAGELLPTRELLAITSDRMDRFGYQKRSTQVNVNIDFAAKLEAARARVRELKKVAAE